MGMQKLVHFSVSAMLLEVCVFFFWFIYLYVLGKCFFEVLNVLCEWCGIDVAKPGIKNVI